MDEQERIAEIITLAVQERRENPWMAYEAAKGRLVDLLGWSRPELYVHTLRKLCSALGLAP